MLQGGVALKQYPVMYGQEAVGTVDVCREGLYYTIQAQCSLPADSIFRLEAKAGEQQLNLGVLTPFKDGFGVSVKVAQKKLQNGELSFVVLPKYPLEQRICYPLRPDEPFAYIDKLYEGFLRPANGRVYLELKDPKPNQQDSGPNPSYPNG